MPPKSINSVTAVTLHGQNYPQMCMRNLHRKITNLLNQNEIYEPTHLRAYETGAIQTNMTLISSQNIKVRQFQHNPCEIHTKG